MKRSRSLLPVITSLFSSVRCVFVCLATVLVISCGGGSVAGDESGIGGTGLTFVKGNVASVNGVSAARLTEESGMLALLSSLISPAVAQTANLSGIEVAGGGKSTTTDAMGDFVLADVQPSNAFMLRFTFPNGRVVNLNIGPVGDQTIVDVSNIAIDTATGQATFTTIAVEDNSAAPATSEPDANPTTPNQNENNDSGNDSGSGSGGESGGTTGGSGGGSGGGGVTDDGPPPLF